MREWEDWELSVSLQQTAELQAWADSYLEQLVREGRRTLIFLASLGLTFGLLVLY
jgi:hypothetical protein